MNISNLKDSNCKISDLINSNKPFSLVRLGAEHTSTIDYLTKNIINPTPFNNAGIYDTTSNILIFELF